jgi:hypothetical protein
VLQLKRGEIGTLDAINALLAEKLTPWEGGGLMWRCRWRT